MQGEEVGSRWGDVCKNCFLVGMVVITGAATLHNALGVSPLPGTLISLFGSSNAGALGLSILFGAFGSMLLGKAFDRTKSSTPSVQAPARLVPAASEPVAAPDFPSIVSQLPGTACSVRLTPDGQLHLLYASTDLRKKYGFPVSHLPHDLRPLFSAIPASDHEPLREAFLRSAATLSTLQVEFRLLDANGRTVWAKGSGTPLRLKDGSTVWHGFVQDVTAQKTAEMVTARFDRGRTMLLEISRSLIGSTNDAAGLAHQIFDSVKEQMDLDLGLNYRVSGTTLHLVAAHGLSVTAEADAKTLQFGQAVCGNVAMSGSPIIVEIDRINSDDMCTFIRDAGAKTYMCYPLRARDGRLLGTMAFGSRTREKYSQHSHQLLALLVAYLGLAWERIEAETASADDRSRLQHALDVSGLGLFDHDIETGSFYASEQFRSIAREPQDKTLSLEKLLSKLSPADRHPIEVNIDRARNPDGDGIHKAEYHLSTLDGHERWLAVHAVTKFDSREGQRRAVRVIGTIGDITERKTEDVNRIKLLEALAAQEAAARHQKVLFRGVFDGAPDAIMVTDVDCRLQHVNSAFLKTFRLAEKDVIGQQSNILYASPLEANHVRELARAHDKNPIMQPTKISFRRGDGSRFIGEMSGAVLMTDTGDRTGYIGLVRDATEDIIRERALQKAQRLEAIGRVTGGVAHDFNNILTILSGNLQFISRSTVDGPTREFIDEAERAIERGARLTRQMMTFSQQRQLSPAVIKLNDVISGMINLIETSVGETIEVKTDLDTALRPTRVDRMEMENALFNLILNARDAMADGGEIIIRTRNVSVRRSSRDEIPHDDVSVQLQVQDNGHGMAEGVLNRIFEPFFTTKDDGKASGLGLAIVHGFVRQSGGSIDVESAPNEGTTITISLPASVGDVEAEPASGDAIDLPLSKGETILVVEDDAAVRRVSVGRLEALGYQVIEAEHGRAALEFLKETEGAGVSLVFSDVVMPGGINGTELLARITSAYPNIAVVLTTGYAKSSLDEPDLLSGDAMVLEKPFSYEQLAVSIRSALDRKKAN